MRKMLIVTMLAIVPAFGCTDCMETMRRVEVWKLQTFFAPSQPVVAAAPCSNPCGAPVAAAPACSCQQGTTAPAAATPTSANYAPAAEDAGTVVPGSVTIGPEQPAETVSTEELNGVLKQP
jgi:hypothetical protein